MARRSISKREPAPKSAAEPQVDRDEQPKKKESALESIAYAASSIVVVLFIMAFNVQAFEIPSASMENTLLIGDHVFVDRISYMPEPFWYVLNPKHEVRRGDIIVFLKPGEPDLHLVKRVVGMPGDRLHLKDGVVYRNGVAQNEPYVIHSAGNLDAYRDDFPNVPPDTFTPITPEWRLSLPQYVQDGDLVVPPDSFFAMGDNRDLSLDSRYWGFVPRANLVGRPALIYWSFETPADQVNKTSVGDRIAFGAKVVIHFLDETRWRRMFRIPR
jgi:signal peptidase I